MTSRPPHYSSLPPKAPPVVLGYTPPPLAPPPPPRVDAPHPIGSRWELRSTESAVIDSDAFTANPGVLHPHDFAPNKEYPRGTVVEIVGHGSRRYKVHSPPLHRDFALYITCVTEYNHPCFSQAGQPIELLPEQIKADRTSSSPVTRILKVHERAYIFSDIENGPKKNKAIVISHVNISRIKIPTKASVVYGAYILEESKWDMRYFIEKELVHDELRPLGHHASSSRGANAQSRPGTRDPPSRLS